MSENISLSGEDKLLGGDPMAIKKTYTVEKLAVSIKISVRPRREKMKSFLMNFKPKSML